MKIFPENAYTFQINSQSASALAKLENQTLLKGQYVADWNNQKFIGVVSKNKFELKLSKKIIGEICVFVGELNGKEGNLHIKTGKTVKIIFMIYVILIVSTIFIPTGYNLLQTILLIIFSILGTRYILMEFHFRYVSKIGLKMISKILEIQRIRKI